jgi:hypothetical protein
MHVGLGRSQLWLLSIAAISLHLPSYAGEFTYRFNLWNEIVATKANRSSPFNPDNLWLDLETWSDSLVASGEASFAPIKQIKFAGSFYNRFDHGKSNTDRLRLKELYANFSLNSHWDVAAGKRILKWGTGYAWTPTGFLDPPRDPRDPTDRLNQYEGRESIEARATYGNHNLTGVFSSPQLFSHLKTRRGDNQWAFKYNALMHGLDYSLVASFGGIHSPNRYGMNATYVIGKALEIHGEAAAQRGSRLLYPLAIAEEDPAKTYLQPPYARLKEHDGRIYLKTLLGINYTFSSGWNLVAEYYRDGTGLDSSEWQKLGEFVAFNEEQHRLQAGTDLATITLPAANLLWTVQGFTEFNRHRDYIFTRLSRTRIARKWELENITIFSMRKPSMIWIPQVSFDFSEPVGVYIRYSHYAGGRNSEFGSLPFRSFLSFGLAFRL